MNKGEPAVTTDEFEVLLNRLVERPVPPVAGRHVYLWHGDPALLGSLVPGELAAGLDLPSLVATLPSTPAAVDAARRLLQAAIDDWFRQQGQDRERRQVVAVSGCSLLMRYRVTLEPFYRASGDSRVVVFVVPRQETAFRPKPPLPAYVSLRPIV